MLRVNNFRLCAFNTFFHLFVVKKVFWHVSNAINIFWYAVKWPCFFHKNTWLTPLCHIIFLQYKILQINLLRKIILAWFFWDMQSNAIYWVFTEAFFFCPVIVETNIFSEHPIYLYKIAVVWVNLKYQKVILRFVINKSSLLMLVLSVILIHEDDFLFN